MTAIKPTVRQGKYVYGILQQIPLTSFELKHREPLFLIRKSLEEVDTKFREKRTIIMLLNDGHETEDPKTGNITLAMPKIPKRENKSDKEFEKILHEHFKKEGKILGLIKAYESTEIDVVIPKIFSAEQYEQFCSIVQDLEVVTLKTILCHE